MAEPTSVTSRVRRIPFYRRSEPAWSTGQVDRSDRNFLVNPIEPLAIELAPGVHPAPGLLADRAWPVAA
jgi:hypothetical protein